MNVSDLTDELLDILRRPNPAVLANLRSDGAPVTAAMWYLWVDGRVMLSFDATRSRLRHLRRDPRASLTVFDGTKWDRHISLQGTVSLAVDRGLIDIDRLAVQFTGAAFPDRASPRITAWLEIDTVHVWGIDAAIEDSGGLLDRKAHRDAAQDPD